MWETRRRATIPSDLHPSPRRRSLSPDGPATRRPPENHSRRCVDALPCASTQPARLVCGPSHQCTVHKSLIARGRCKHRPSVLKHPSTGCQAPRQCHCGQRDARVSTSAARGSHRAPDRELDQRKPKRGGWVGVSVSVAIARSLSKAGDDGHRLGRLHSKTTIAVKRPLVLSVNRICPMVVVGCRPVVSDLAASRIR